MTEVTNIIGYVDGDEWFSIKEILDSLMNLGKKNSSVNGQCKA